jgi:hypothetical protein
MSSIFIVKNDEGDSFTFERFEEALYTFMQIYLNDAESAELRWSA